MASYIDTLRQRGKIGAAAVLCLRSEGGKSICSKALVPNLDEIALVPAAPYESATLTFHRIESTGSKTVVLATTVDGKGILVMGSVEKSREASEGREQFDLVGGMTTEAWVRLIRDEGASLSFTANGNEFATELSSLNEFATV